MAEHSGESAHIPKVDWDADIEAWVCADHGMPECQQGECPSLFEKAPAPACVECEGARVNCNGRCCGLVVTPPEQTGGS